MDFLSLLVSVSLRVVVFEFIWLCYHSVIIVLGSFCYETLCFDFRCGILINGVVTEATMIWLMACIVV